MKRQTFVGLVLFLALIAVSVPVRADVKTPAIFGSDMVLQREIRVPVWGWADPGEAVSVSFGGQTAATRAGADGKWKVLLRPVKASAQGQALSVKGKNTLTFNNVVVGDVWVCSGQSNMERMPTQELLNREQEIMNATHPLIRMIMVARDTSATAPRGDFRGKWAVCTPDTMRSFSSAAYFFARDLQEKMPGVPIGLVGTYFGGTAAQAWTRHEVLEKDPQFAFYLKKWDLVAAKIEQTKAADDAAIAAWRLAVNRARAAGQQPPRRPASKLRPQDRPASLYNGMVAPLIPFAIRGVIWYQGESNANSTEDATLYVRLFSAMIADWRAQWGQGNFPFIYVQLANYMKRWDEPSDSLWARLRESQLKTLAVPNTAMAVIIDAGETALIHPPNKQAVGARLALAARKVAYGEKIEFSGPIFSKMKIKNGQATLSFTHLGGGLVNKAAGGAGVKGFAIAGADRKFVWAEAKIEGSTVVVSSPQVKDPVAVRYGWADNPEVSLYNAQGLPASPFRTDDWALENLMTKKMEGVQ